MGHLESQWMGDAQPSAQSRGENIKGLVERWND